MTVASTGGDVNASARTFQQGTCLLFLNHVEITSKKHSSTWWWLLSLITSRVEASISREIPIWCHLNLAGHRHFVTSPISLMSSLLVAVTNKINKQFDTDIKQDECNNFKHLPEGSWREMVEPIDSIEGDIVDFYK